MTVRTINNLLRDESGASAIEYNLFAWLTTCFAAAAVDYKGAQISEIMVWLSVRFEVTASNLIIWALA